jgi:hypothetical protein
MPIQRTSFTACSRALDKQLWFLEAHLQERE